MLIAPTAGDHAFRVYVGQAQNVLQRLIKHERSREFPRYLQVAVIVSTDDQMRGDVALYLEQRMIQALVKSDMVMVENRALRFPALHQDDQIVAEQFFRDALLLLGPVEPMAAMVASTIASQERRNELVNLDASRGRPFLQSNVIYEFRRDGCQAYAVHANGRSMRVLAGATIVDEEHFSLPRRCQELRQRLRAAGSVVRCAQDGLLTLLIDVDLFSQTGAADFVAGRRTLGTRLWKLANFTLEDERDV
ncbi:hypothetical protein SAMN05421844_10463 [Bosea robiniae]|uniref:GIY-YIG nuclease family protein n=2 Tax=Bosea robiniae TaxID=1036780 RepID=A0ABY0NZ84_9HYPH|nr:hypothetical protein SAMN05421844_10463 [Bosea robiniae]